MVWCPLGNRELIINGGLLVDGNDVKEFSIGGPCEGCEKDFGLASRHRRYGLPSYVVESEIMDDDRFAEEYVIAVLVNIAESEVIGCEIDEVL